MLVLKFKKTQRVSLNLSYQQISRMTLIFKEVMTSLKLSHDGKLHNVNKNYILKIRF